MLLNMWSVYNEVEIFGIFMLSQLWNKYISKWVNSFIYLYISIFIFLFIQWFHINNFTYYIFLFWIHLTFHVAQFEALFDKLH